LLIGLFFWFILGVSPFGYCKTIKIPVKNQKNIVCFSLKKSKYMMANKKDNP